MKPRRFAYHAPHGVDEALALLDEFADDAKVLAGGQSLMPMLLLRLASPAHLVDINAIGPLAAVTRDGAGARIGATVRQSAVENATELAVSFPVLCEAMRHIAHPQIRNRGTVCGSLAHADGAAELPAVMCCLGAEMYARSARGDRTIKAADFFRFHLATALEPNELLVEVRIPASPARTRGSFVEVARRAGDFALVGAAVQATFSETGVVDKLRIVCSGVAPVPWTADEAAELALGAELSDAALIDIDQTVRRTVDPPDDVHASAAYRRVVAGTLVRRALDAIRSSTPSDRHGT